MNILRLSFVAAALAGAALFAAPVWAHAFLDHAVPSVGSTSQGAPRQLVLSFTQNIVPAFSGVSLTSPAGASVPTGKVVVAPSDPATLQVSIGRTLSPGTYVVHWHVVSVDTHHTSGSYKFTIAP
ncbi:copper homeostasis periplasmic binding protein CopC [Rhodoblastus sp.]|uniref:copper homeostasis periplasmic binding protein CopC n=1 Tax=Rhodoblastus sp. TaxID=1962975 RepID=UPI003FD6EA7E